ncbi:MAG: insulinase family protein [Desulfobacterales bacterium]
MEHAKDPNNPERKTGDRIGDYEVRRTAELKVIKAFYYELEHLPTGARHVHISNADTENTFSVAFKTVPRDSTGVAHILEHTVLCGSRKFPVRDPFFSMIKRSLNTFMNAFTSSDWTMYPFTTQNRKDFYNLMDVYLDAAFYPRIDRLNFMQEGHRLEMEGENLVYKGVVYNEMKGAMSSPHQILSRKLMNALYPDTTYCNNSGGDPQEIPALTHEQLAAFHKRHYHPSNAYFFTYGNLPLKDHLDFIEEKVLRNLGKIDPQTDVPNQPRWSEPRTVTYFYPLDASENPEKKCQICLGWLVSDLTDTFGVLTLSLLGQILLGNAASPLRKALIDSGLGTSLSDSTGYDPDCRDTLFACGLKDVRESDADEIVKIILDTLETLVRDGIDRQLIEAAIHQLEFHRREITNTPYPYGIKLLMSFAGTWFHGASPLNILEFDEDLARLKAEVEKGPFFENQIRRYFLDNPHRVLFKLLPDQEMARKEEERVAAELAEIRKKLTQAEMVKIREDAAALEKLQESPEDLSVLPTLELTDIPPHVPSVNASEPYSRQGNLAATWYAQPCSGIFYFTAVAGIGTVPDHLIPLLPFFCHAFTRVGTARRDYVEMARVMDICTGGMGLSAHAKTRFDRDGETLPFVTFSGKCLVRNQEKMFDLIREFLAEYSFADLPRIKKLLPEYRASMESGIVSNGHRYAISLAARNFSQTRSLNEIWSGVHQLKMIKDVTGDMRDGKLQTLSQNLMEIAAHLFTRENMKFALIGEDAALSSAVSPVQSLMKEMEAGRGGFCPPDMQIHDTIPREGWTTSTAVSFVARTFGTVPMQHEDAPVLSVISKMLRSLYLHREIREKGGAYGGFSIYNMEDGLFCLCSYRDPHIVNTLDVYEKAADFIRSGYYAEEDIKEAILQVCSDIDKPDTPAHAARKAFYRQLIGLSDETRRQFKEQLLKTTRKQVMAVAEKYFYMQPEKHAVAVISDEEKLKAANGELKDRGLTLHRI